MKLGFNPEGLLWAYDFKDEKHRLWLVWSGLDRYGPLAMSRLLFKAYRAAALPEEIDPFTVHIVSPEHMIGHLSKNMHVKLPNDQNALYWRIKDNHGNIVHQVAHTWVYHLETKRFNTKKVDRDWRAFNENVSALAA